jgi:riboflavin kinase / FMN adenylyltransferase
VTIGAYDGVHLGHRRVIDQLVRRAREGGLQSVVVTFDRHPAQVVHPESAPALLTDLDQKLELLAATGVDHIEVLRFDEERSREPAEDFVREVLVGELNARVVVVGDDFHFGHGRRGNVALLREMGAEAGFSVEPLHLVEDDSAHEIVSSTRIRSLIAKGELAEAAVLLGRDHEVRGTIAPRGPEEVSPPPLTVEVPPEILLPPPGSYEGSIAVGGADPVAARLTVLERVAGGPQRVEVGGGAVAAGGQPGGGGEGEVVRARFSGT